MYVCAVLHSLGTKIVTMLENTLMSAELLAATVNVYQVLDSSPVTGCVVMPELNLREEAVLWLKEAPWE